MATYDFDKWATEVRDPAQANTEGERVLEHGRAHVAYQIAPVPGGWAWKAEAVAGYAVESTPWQGRLPTRPAALDEVLAFLRPRMRAYIEIAKDQHVEADDVRRVADDLADGLFGFMEPEPEPVTEDSYDC